MGRGAAVLIEHERLVEIAKDGDLRSDPVDWLLAHGVDDLGLLSFAVDFATMRARNATVAEFGGLFVAGFQLGLLGGFDETKPRGRP